MKCLVCDCLFPLSYDKCPVCGNHAITKEQFAPQIEEIEEIEVVTPYAVGGDIDDFES